MTNEYTKRIAGMLGLASRARKLAIGTDLACDNVRIGKADLLMVAFDASVNTKKRVFNCAKYYETACYEIPISSADLGHCIGKKGNTAAVAVLDRNMIKGIEKILNEMNTQTSKTDNDPWEV